MTNFGVSLKTLLYASGNKSGVWEAGVACAKSGVVGDYWNTAVTFTSSTTMPTSSSGPIRRAHARPARPLGHTAATATFTKNQAGSFIAASSGCPAPTITETGELPTGVTLKTGVVISGKPTVTGTFKITLSAKVGTGKAATQAFSLVVKSDRPMNPGA